MKKIVFLCLIGTCLLLNRTMLFADNAPNNDAKMNNNNETKKDEIKANNETKTDEKAEKSGIWFELWSDTAYHSTNFATDTQYYISQNSAKMGYRFPIVESVFIDPYFRMDVVHDFSTQDDAYWNNHWEWGPGIRARYEYRDENKPQESKNTQKSKKLERETLLWVDNLNFDVFTEYLVLEDSFDNSKDKIEKHVQRENYRLGISLWVSFISKKYYNFNLFGEMWSELSYNTTNFATSGYDFYILMMQPKVGLSYQIIEHVAFQAYYKFDLTRDFGTKDWNKAEWLNTFDYGPGLRFSLTDLIGFKGSTIHIFFEYLSREHFSRVDKNSYNSLADRDYRVGIEIWLPLGATKSSVLKH